MLWSVALGLGMFILTTEVLSVPIVILLRIATNRRPGSLTRPSYGANLLVINVMTLLFVAAHLVNIALWAVLYCLCGEFSAFETAFYYSAVNYSSLGYGDIVLSARWRLLGPIEALDGVVMVGISTALMFAVIMRLIERRIQAMADHRV